MILNEFLTVLYISFLSVSSPYNPNYEYSANIGFQSQLKPCVVEATTDNPCFIDAKFNMTAHLSYNDETSYTVDTFKFSVYLDFYYISQDGTETKENSLSFKFAPNWSVNQGSWASSKVATFNFTYGIDHDDDEMYIKFYDDSTLVDQKRLTTDNSYYYHSYVNYYIDTTYLADAINSRLLALHQSESEITDAYNNGYGAGYTQGAADGWEEASQVDTTAVTIFSGILSVGLLPVNFFLAILNFEVFGINIGAFVSALLTVAIIVIVTRMVVNGGNGKD